MAKIPLFTAYKIFTFGHQSKSHLSEKTKILFIRFSSIGDVLLTTPVVRCVKEQIYGGCEIHYLIKKTFLPVIENNIFIDKIHVLQDNEKVLIEELKKEDFHYIIDLHKNLRSHYFRKKLKVLTFTFNKLNIQKWILVNFKIDLLPDIHIVDRYFEAVKHFDIKNDGKGLDFFIPENEEIDVKVRFGILPDTYVAFAIGGAHEGKKLPLHKIIKLCSLIKRPVILIGGREDAEVGKKISESSAHVINACGELTLNGSASLLKQSRLVLSHDSGMMHLASVFKKKIISVWGATVPKFGMYPYKAHPDSVLIQADHLKFRPTSKLGNRNSKREKRTTEEIDLKEIIKYVDKMW